MNSLNISPQSPSSAINFIDGADEAQLKAMVAARNGYSAIALSKLQSIRDAKMKAQAAQPTPPPLSESIPQQLDQLKSPQPQQAPQQMPQQAPQQAMGIASIGGSPTGAGGGMVAFKEGGYPPPKMEYADYNTIPAMYAKEDPNRTNFDFSTPQTAGGSIADYIKYGMKKPASFDAEFPINSTLVGKIPGVSAPSVPMLAGADKYPSRPVSPGGITNVAASAKPVTTNKAGASSKGIASVDPSAAAQSFYDQAKSYTGSLSSLTGDSPERRAAMGDVNAETTANINAMKSAMPDRMQKFADEAAKDREGIEKEKGEVVPQALLVLASSLMNPSVRNGQGLSGFLSSVGEAVPKGLTEMQKLKSAVSDKLQKQKQLEMTIASGQEARDRGMFDIASRQAQNAQNQRLDLVKSDNNLLGQSYLAQSQIAMHQADIPFKQAKLEIDKQTLAVHKLQAMKPSALQESIAFAKNFAKTYNLNEQEILNRVVPGLGDSKYDSLAKELAKSAYESKLRFDPAAAQDLSISTLFRDIRASLPDLSGKTEKTGGKLVAGPDGKMVWQQ